MINEIDLARLPPITVMGVNGAYALKVRLDFQLNIIVDMSFINHCTDVLLAISADLTLIFFTTLHGIAWIIDRLTLATVCCRLALIEDVCYCIYQPRVPCDGLGRHFSQEPHIWFSQEHPDIAFTTDIRSGIFDAGTVVYLMLQILFFLLYLGITHLYIAGLDMTNFHKPRFYQTDHDKLPSFLAEKFASVIIPSFTMDSEVLQQNGVEVKNLLLNSALSDEIFEKVSLNDAFQN